MTALQSRNRGLLPWALLLPFVLGGCATTATEEATTAADVTLCEMPRPQVCTMDYRPVCATLKDDSRKTYANGCGACADEAVVSWVENACPE